MRALDTPTNTRRAQLHICRAVLHGEKKKNESGSAMMMMEWECSPRRFSLTATTWKAGAADTRAAGAGARICKPAKLEVSDVVMLRRPAIVVCVVRKLSTGALARSGECGDGATRRKSKREKSLDYFFIQCDEIMKAKK